MSAWANIEKPESESFADIISEGISKHWQTKKENLILDASKDGWIWIESDEGNNDLKNSEKHIEEKLKVLSHRCHGDNYLNNDTENDLEEQEVKDSYDVFDLLEDELTHCEEESNNCELQNSDEVINKYDIILTGKKADSKVPSLNHNFKNEDGRVRNLKSYYRLFRSIKTHLPQQEIDSKEIRNMLQNDELFMDRQTHNAFFSMFVNGLLINLDNIINVGEYGMIYCGILNPSFQNATKDWPKQCVIKVYKDIPELSYSQFFRYKENHLKISRGIKLICRGVGLSLNCIYKDVNTAEQWAQRAMDNQKRAWEAGVPCPQVIKLKSHVLVMSSIGEDMKPAVTLKNASLSHRDFVKAYEQVKNGMKMLYEKANLIHSDLSEYNILWQDGQCYFVDFTYSVSAEHYYADDFLLLDCMNVIDYFGSRIPNIEPAKKLFRDIAGFSR